MDCIFPHCSQFLDTMWYCHWCSVCIFCDWFTLVLLCICCKLTVAKTAGHFILVSIFCCSVIHSGFVQNFPSYVNIGVLFTVRCVCVWICHTHTYIVHDLQMDIRTMQKNSDSNCFSSTVCWLITNRRTSSVPENTHFIL